MLYAAFIYSVPRLTLVHSVPASHTPAHGRLSLNSTLDLHKAHRARSSLLMYVATIQSLNYTGQELKQQQRQQQNTRFAIYAFYRLVTLKQGQRNQTWYRSIDPKQGYHHVRFERLKAS